eukprot:TRINITY_DN8075_c0_g1_i2.p1 TRINITY_DN8075_c0_g1~~TRINITY_DN8075_c0_g1_i2.p1  ORF type:complete len:180 (-),score=42.06 TRINITY_DN8075_c0_g1_i2:60-599(-)
MTGISDKPREPGYVEKGTALLAWFVFNLTTLTVNKVVLFKLQFSYPLALTATHMLTCYIMCFLVIKVFKRVPAQPQSQEHILKFILPLSVIFCVNICLGNVSLNYIPISFFQTIKSSVPVFTVLIQALFMKKNFTLKIYLSLIPIVGGLGLASFTEVNFNMTGFTCAVLSSALTATVIN